MRTCHRRLDKSLNKEQLLRIHLIEKAVSDRVGNMHFCSIEDDMPRGVCSLAEDGNVIVDATTMDKELPDMPHAFVTFDIEGAELSAIKGGRDWIKRNRPNLAISVYHRKEDLITIPQFLKEIDDQYTFYLEHYVPWNEEVVLYAIHER